MSAYDNKLYAFLTKKENFEPYSEMVNHFETIKYRLLTEFWGEVYKGLRAPGRWKIFKDDIIPDRWAKVGFYQEQYSTPEGDIMAIAFEHLDRDVLYGLWFARDILDSPFDFKAVCEYVKQQLKDWTAGSGGWYYAARRDTGDDFSKPEHLLRILPENRSTVVKEYAGYLNTALIELEAISRKYLKGVKR